MKSSLLISPYEVIACTGLGKTSDLTPLTDPLTIKVCIIEVFGIEGWELLQSSLVVYNADDWQDGTSYAVGDLVLYYGVVYVCIEATTGNQNPKNACHWDLAPKFEPECLDDLWCECVKPWLCWAIVVGNVQSLATKTDGSGVYKIGYENVKSLDKVGLEAWVAEQQSKLEMAWKLLLLCFGVGPCTCGEVEKCGLTMTVSGNEEETSGYRISDGDEKTIIDHAHSDHFHYR